VGEVHLALLEECPTADDDLLAVQRAGDTLTGDVLEPFRLAYGKGHPRRLPQHGFRQRMLRASFRNGSGSHDAIRSGGGARIHARDFGVAQGQCVGLVEHDGVHRA
jgi:hypothetical protein